MLPWSRFPTIRAHFAFRSLCSAGCGNSCYSVIGRAFPHPGISGTAAPIPPLPGRFGHLIMTHSFQRRSPAGRAYFAFRSLCSAGCGNSCSSVIGRAFPPPDLGGCRPHTPLPGRFGPIIVTHSFQRRSPAGRAYFAFLRLCFTGCGNSCSSVTGKAFPYPDPGGFRPHTPLPGRFRP